ncbi:MAG TPA: nuclear transport factor 2 family protein [Blastocatellia bacterium]|nr:nuclear transport factor 2 family protein [Blastocatellia bacterium]
MNTYLKFTIMLATACLCFAGPDRSPSEAAAHQSESVKARSREETLIANERRLWEALKAKDAVTFNELVAADAALVDARGSLSAAEFLRALADASVSDYSLLDMKVIRISRGAALITYVARGKIVRRGQETASPPHHNATIWAKRRGKWLIVFHQSTPAPLAGQRAG